VASNHAGSQHQLVADDFGVDGGFFQCCQVESGSFHRYNAGSALKINSAHYKSLAARCKCQARLITKTFDVVFSLLLALFDFFGG